MNKTEIKKDQLAKMSDLGIDKAVHELITIGGGCVPPGDIRNKTGGWFCVGKKCEFPELLPDYCNDWSATGPLMLKYKISFIDDDDENRLACSDLHIDELMDIAWDYSSDNKNPLRAICEVILMMGGKP